MFRRLNGSRLQGFRSLLGSLEAETLGLGNLEGGLAGLAALGEANRLLVILPIVFGHDGKRGFFPGLQCSGRCKRAWCRRGLGFRGKSKR